MAFLKPSKYNYITRNNNYELLLFNSFYGSFGKVTKKNADNYFILFKSESVEDIKINQKLVSMGFFIPIEEDENKKINFLKKINNNILSLIILPTEQCNFRCEYCYEDFKREKMTIELQESIIKHVKKYLHNYTGLAISWFGGEPLLAIDVIERIGGELKEFCKNIKRSYTSSITTNGYLLNIDIFKRLLAVNVLNYQITIDGLKNTHDKQRYLVNGSGTFERIVNNLINIRDEIKTGKFKITIRTNFTNDMKGIIDEYKKYYYNTFGDDQRFNFFIRPAGDYGGERIQSFVKNLIKKDDFPMVMNCFNDDNIKLRFSFDSFLQPYGSACYAGQLNSVVIDAEGNLRKCTCNLNDMENNYIGKIKKDGDMEINICKHAEWITGYDKNEKCDSCFLLPSCMYMTCPAQKIVRKNNKLPCPYEFNNIDTTLILIDKDERFTLIE